MDRRVVIQDMNAFMRLTTDAKYRRRIGRRNGETPQQAQEREAEERKQQDEADEKMSTIRGRLGRIPGDELMDIVYQGLTEGVLRLDTYPR